MKRISNVLVAGCVLVLTALTGLAAAEYFRMALDGFNPKADPEFHETLEDCLEETREYLK